jgi:hypothetical protein
MRCGWVDSGHTPARCPVGGLPEDNGAPAVMVRNLLGLERALLSFAATPQARVRAVQGRPCAGLCARWGGMGRGGGASARLLAPAQVLPPSWRLGALCRVSSAGMRVDPPAHEAAHAEEDR